MHRYKPSMAVTFDNILVATDFSSQSEIALKYATTIATHYGSTIHVAHVICPETQRFTSNTSTTDLDSIRCRAAEDMECLLRSDVLRGVHHESVVREGDVDQVLKELIQSRGIDLIVMGARTGSLCKLKLGLFVDDRGEAETKPVLLVGPNVSGDGESKIQKILFATNMAESTLKALPFAVSLATHHHSELRLLYLSSNRGEPIATEQESLEWQLLEHVRLQADFTRKPEFVVDHGDPVRVIAENAVNQGADLIVFGQSAADDASRFLRGDVAFQLVCRSRCPVLLVCDATANESLQAVVVGTAIST